jgi:hypothetical protein
MASGRSAAGALIVLVMITASACGNGATGVDDCKRIEEARCNRATLCGIPLTPPYSTSGSSADECIRFYDVACLHGLEASPMKSAQVDACVSAIHNSKSCDVVLSPETDPACAWLVPAASAAADASDGTADASTEATEASD